MSGDAVAAVLGWPERQAPDGPCGVGISEGKSSKVIQVLPQSLDQWGKQPIVLINGKGGYGTISGQILLGGM